MRVLLTVLLPLLAPALLYFLYMSSRGRAGSAIQEVPWTWLAIAGGALMLITLGAVALLGGADPGTAYQPPHMENGEIAPGQFDE